MHFPFGKPEVSPGEEADLIDVDSDNKPRGGGGGGGGGGFSAPGMGMPMPMPMGMPMPMPMGMPMHMPSAFNYPSKGPVSPDKPPLSSGTYVMFVVGGTEALFFY